MAHLGNTVINGALRVLGGEYVDTINGVTVGSSPKFSDTLYNFSGVAFKSGGQNNETHDANAATSNGNYYYSSNGPATSIGASTNDGALYVQSHSANWVAQIAQDYRNGNLFVRGRNNGTWQSWKQVAYKSDISTLQTNFQAGVDSVYNAIVAEGTTPASKSLSDVVAGIDTMSTNRYNKGTADGYATKRNQLTATYTPTGSGGSKLDMGSNHNNRYVNTNTVYNTGTTNGYNAKVAQLTATYTPTGSGGSALDMGSNHNNRYVNTNTVYNTGTTNGYNTKKNSLTGTYTPTGSGGSRLDMGADHTNRYVNTNTVYNTGTTNGYNAKVAQLTATYTPTGSGGSKLDMGSNHNNRYVDTTAVYNSGTSSGYTSGYNAGTTAGYNTKKNSLTGTYTPTGSGGSRLDMGADHTYRYVNTNTVYNTGTTNGYNTKKNSLTGTYTPTGSGGSRLDMGADHTNRYVNTNTVYNTGTTNGYNAKVAQLTATYTPTGSGGSKLDMGSNHNYRYVNTNTVYNTGTTNGYNSGTAAGYTSGYNAGTTDGYNTKKNSLTGTYKPSSNGSRLDMGADHTYRYVNTTAVYNSGTTSGYNSGTAAGYTSGYNAGTAAGYTSGYNAGTSAGYTSGYNAGTTAGYNTKKDSLTGTYKPSSNGSRLDMGADHTYRYVNTTAVYNSGTAAGYTSGYNAGTADGYDTKRNQLTGTYKPTSRSSRANMGSNHNYRYVDTTAVPNNNDAGLYGITGSYATVQWGDDGAYSGFKLNVGITLYALGANSANSKYSYNIKSNQKIIIVVSPDLRNGTSPTASCTRAANTVTITALNTSNPGIKVWKAECLSGSTYVYFTCNYPYFYTILVIGN